ncbi:TPA: hypothetical protein ACLGOT_001001 [Salmonella enterica]
MDKISLEGSIERLSASISCGSSVLVCSCDGDLIAHTGYKISIESSSIRRIAVQTSTILGVSTSIGMLLQLGGSNEISFSGPNGRVFVFRLNDIYSLAVITSYDCNIAMINLMAARCIDEITQKGMLS